MNKHSNGKRLSASKGILLLLAAVITALAVAVTCAVVTSSPKKVSVKNDVEQGEVTTSANYTNVTGTGIQTYINGGTFTNGNYVDYTYNGSYYSVTIPQGTWKWELWGARGGWTGNNGANTGTANGGLGGYVAAQVTYSSATTIYVYCGGTGAAGEGSIDGNNTTWRYGGYNGGGDGIGRAGSGGGGATDIRTTGGTASTASSYNTRVLVAAGGGGGTSTTYTQAYSSSGSLWLGGSGDVARHVSSYSNDEGGGGGGYYGGAARHGDDAKSSYCGNNFVGSGYTQQTNSLGYSGSSGNGKARLTAVSINQAPVTLNYSLNSGKVRGTTNISIAASSIAKDNDYANYSGGAANKVYFTNGTTTNFDTLPAANAGLYMNSALSINASSYMTYSWTADTLTIATITKLPRSGVDGQTANNTFTLYTKVRDGFGSTTSRGVATISFTLTVTDQAIAAKSSYYVNNQYKFGDANYNAIDPSVNYAESYSDGKIYNPLGTGSSYKTIFIPKPLSPTDTVGYTVNAADIFTDADTAYDKVGFKTITAHTNYTSYSSYYSLTLNSDSTYATGIFPSFTLKSTGVRPVGAPYVVMTITAQTSETNSKAQIGGTITAYLVFQISNTRPYFGSTNVLTTKLAEPVITIAVGQSQQLKLNQFLYDMDDGATLKATLAQGANDLIVPTREWIQVDTSNVEVPLASNVGSNYYGKAGGVASDSKTTGMGNNSTYFKSTSIAPTGGNGAATANVTYRYVDSQTIEFTGRAASVNQYRTGTNGADTDSTRKGHFYILVRVIDPSDTADNGIWFPIAIEVTSQAPTEPTTFANVTVGFSQYSAGTASSPALGGTPEPAYLTPIGYLDTDGTLKGIGSVSGTNPEPLALDRDAFLVNGALNDWVTVNGNSASTAILDNDANTTGSFFTVELVTMTAPKAYFAMIPDNALSVANNAYGVQLDNNNCSFYGLKITPLRSTNGEYYQFKVKVKDIHGATAEISVCVKVENRALSPRLDPNDAEHSINTLEQRRVNGLTPYGEYVQNASLGGKVTNYTIEVMDELQITPYDFAYDFDVDPNGTLVNPGASLTNYTSFNSNPYDNDRFNAVADNILRTYSIAHTTEPATSAAQKTAEPVQAQVLYFANETSIRSYNEQYSNYISVTTEPTSGFNASKAIPSIRITGISRTSSAIVQISFSITDGVDVVTCMFTITVLNSSPLLNTEANHPITDDDNWRLSDYYNLTAFTDAGSTAILPNIRTFTISQFAYDKDGDIPTFNSSSVKIVAYDESNTNTDEDAQLNGTHYFEYVYYDSARGRYFGCGSGRTGAVYLANYVSALITKGSGGADVLQIQGLSSTELFSLPIYVEVEVNDGYRAQPMSAVLHLLINVQNSAPVFVTENLLKSEVTDEETSRTSDQYTWLISYEVSSEIAQTRYLFNSKDLYDNSPISAPESNKIYLFDDYDAEQHVMLNPKEFAYIDGDNGRVVDRTSLVATVSNRVMQGDDQIGIRQFTQSDFDDDLYKNAAVVYTPMYEDLGGERNLFNQGYVNVTIRFFDKRNGSFVERATNADVADCEYWAIEIQDLHSTGVRWPIQFTLSVKDNHHDQILYQEPDKKEQNTTAHSSELQVYNFYYNYRSPGIQAMHMYYRTDGNAESKVLLSGDPDQGTAVYLVDQSNITSKDFDPSETTEDPDSNGKKYDALNKDTIDGAKARQAILGYVKFADDFKYRYYERTYSVQTTINGQSVTQTYATKKTFPTRTDTSGNYFGYSPITVNPDGLDAKFVPMSYIALPKGASGNTVDNLHVVFANSGYSDSGNNLSGGNVLDNKTYYDWTSADLVNVYKNITLSDGVNSWPIEQNPYINVEYVVSSSQAAQGRVRRVTFDNTLMNSYRFSLSAEQEGGTISPNTGEFENSQYHEDRYGFAISKKEGGPRAPGILKLTIALKTTDPANNESEVEMVDVEINLLDSAPDVKYFSEIANDDANLSGDYIETTMYMTIGSSTDDTILTLENRFPQNLSSADKGKIYYSDPDSTDTLKFYMPSAIKGGLSSSEVNNVFESMNGSIGLGRYLGVASSSGLDSSAYVDKEFNPGYDMFFDVSPATGSASSIQFIPKAKTVPNFPSAMGQSEKDEYYTKYHLEVDDDEGSLHHGKVYYPYRVLFYDESNGSAFTEGYCYLALIRVYIDNDPLTVNANTVKSTYTRSVTSGSPLYPYRETKMYSVMLSKNVSFYVDVTSLLIDNDIVLEGNYYTTESDTTASGSEWSKLSEDERYIKDYLIMPKGENAQTPDGVEYVDLTYLEYSSSLSDHVLPFTVSIGKVTSSAGQVTNLPATTIAFATDHAFKDERNICFTFRDSGGSSVNIVFNVSYNNETPTQNSDTFGVSTRLDVYMRTGDTIYLYAGDYTKFSLDAQGGFTSYSQVTEIYNGISTESSNPFKQAKSSAEDMHDEFKYFADRYNDPDGRYTGNSLVLASDDAPTTLRIVSASVPTLSREILPISYHFELAREDQPSQNGNLCISITANGVITDEATIILMDGNGKQVTVYVRITVASTAPTARTTGLPTGLTYNSADSTYSVDMKYGDVMNILLGGINNRLMDDVDEGDVNNLSVYADMGGTQFNIVQPGDTPVVSVAATYSSIGSSQVTITATDFINISGSDNFASITFRVQDAHGSVSEPITIKVTILPQTVSAVAASAATPVDITVMSYEQFISADNAGEPQEVAIVESGSSAKLFRDGDANAPSAQYNVEVFVLLKRSETGSTMNPDPNSNISLYRRTASEERTNTADAESRYALQFFEIESSEDGKILRFIPKAATLRSGNNIGNIPIKIVVEKRYADNSIIGNPANVNANVTVGNSRLLATTNNSFNMGYPLVNEDSDILRDSQFLSFTGSKGDSLTWKLYDNNNSNLGLFYDYDMLNLDEEDGGKEYIKYIDYSYSIPNETGNTANDPVLSISYNDARHELTITINRNVTKGQPNPQGEENKPTAVEVKIYAVDAVNDVAGVTKNSTDRVTVTTITVNVQNDRPEIAKTGRVLVCPYCGESEHVRQTSDNTATCGDCNHTFKSLDPERLRYSIVYDNENGYVMDLTLKYGQSININIADIIDDADIDMDAYVMLNTGSENSLKDRDGNDVEAIRAGDEVAFRASYHSAANRYRVTTLSYITFNCVSTTRGAVALCTVKFRDSYIGSETSILTIRLTVGNIAPTVKEGAKTNLTVMGVGVNATDDELANSSVEFNILDIITDANGDNYDPAAEGNSTRTPTYTYIDEIVVYTREDDSAANRPDLYGPSLMGETTNEETGETEYTYTTDTACMVNWVADDLAHQKFRIELLRGIYGVQKITLVIIDSGYEDGMFEGVVGDPLELTLYITVANPLDDVEEVLESKQMVYGVTRTIYASDLLGEDNARGYEIVDIQEINTNYLRIYGPDGVATSADTDISDWRIQAVTENVSTQVKVTFRAGEIERERILPITIVNNKKPVLKQDYYRYTVSMLDDKANRTIKIKPTDWFTDDDEEDIMTFISPVTSSQTVKVEVFRAVDSEEDGGQPYIMLKFVRRGEAVITVNLTDLSGRSYTYEVKVECTDAPVLSWWEDKMALIEANWMWFWIIVAATLAVIIILIIIIVVAVRKRRMRREIEALLESETELETEMLKLSMGPAAFPSFGYLPPTPQGGVNPGMMLGGGQSAPQQQSLQLNAGVGTPPPPPPPPPQQQPGYGAQQAHQPPQQPGYGAPQQPGYGAQSTQHPAGGDGFDPNNF